MLVVILSTLSEIYSLVFIFMCVYKESIGIVAKSCKDKRLRKDLQIFGKCVSLLTQTDQSASLKKLEVRRQKTDDRRQKAEGRKI